MMLGLPEGLGVLSLASAAENIHLSYSTENAFKLAELAVAIPPSLRAV